MINRTNNAVTWASRVRGTPATNILNAEEYPPLRSIGGINRSQETRKEVRSRATPKPILRRERTNQQVEEPAGRSKRGQVIVTLLPVESSNGTPITLRKKLQLDKIDPTKYGVIKCSNRQDGALIITFPSSDERKRFIEDIAGLQYKIQDEQYIPYEVRIHTLPEGANGSDVVQEVRKRCGADPIRVELIPYRETNEKHRGLHFAAVSCDSNMYRELAAMQGRISGGSGAV